MFAQLLTVHCVMWHNTYIHGGWRGSVFCGQTCLDPHRTQKKKDIFGKAQNITELIGTSKFTSFETVATATRHNTAGEVLSQQSVAPWISNCGGMHARWRWSRALGTRPPQHVCGAQHVRGPQWAVRGQRFVLEGPGQAPKGEAAKTSC